MEFYRFEAIVSLHQVRLVAYLFHSRALLLSVAFLYVRPTAMQKLDCEKVATLFKITFISTRITFPLKNIIIRVALFLISNPVKILSNSAAIFRLRFIRDTLICFMINNITTFVRKYIYIYINYPSFSFVIHQFNFEPRYVNLNITYERAYVYMYIYKEHFLKRSTKGRR